MATCKIQLELTDSQYKMLCRYISRIKNATKHATENINYTDRYAKILNDWNTIAEQLGID
jgi:hypothetical protein